MCGCEKFSQRLAREKAKEHTTNASRLLLASYVWMGVSAAAQGGPKGVGVAVAFVLMAMALRSCHYKFKKMAYAAMSLACIAEGRIFGALGYVAAMVGGGGVANKLLAFHYGLVALDSAEETVLDRVAATGAMLNFAL